MHQIKQTPEEFYVREITNVKPAESGKYAYFWLKKRNYTTLRAVQQIADALNVPVKRIGFAGTKDKFAVTEQLVSVEAGRERAENLKFKDIELKFYGYGSEPISLGDLNGNYFEIVVADFKEMNEKPKILNLYGVQRFSKNNDLVGKAIVKKDFKKAVELILENDGDNEGVVKESLETNPTDYVGALRKIPQKILKIYVHAYQSRLWNLACGELLGKSKENQKIPLIGFGTEIEDKKIKKIIEKIMEKEQINFRDFIIKQMPELSSEGGERDMFAEVKGFKVLDKKENWVKVAFTLPKGSYATVAIDEIFK